MSFESLNYYGYNKEIYRHCLEFIKETNLHHARILNIWFSILYLIVFFLSKLNVFTLMSGNPKVYLSYFILATVWNLIIAFSKTYSNRKIKIAVSLNMLFLYSFSIYCSVIQPYMSASIFPVIIVVIAFSYINTMLFMGTLLLGGSALFLWSSYVFKPLAITYIDLYNILLFLVLAFNMHYTFQKMR